MERLLNIINQIKIYNKCYCCDFYNEDEGHCIAEDVNCDEEIARQIRNEIIDEIVDKIKSCPEYQVHINSWYAELIESMKE